MTTLVLIHGAWHGPWCWDKVKPFLKDYCKKHNKKINIITPDFSQLKSIEEFKNKLDSDWFHNLFNTNDMYFNKLPSDIIDYILFYIYK